MLPDTIPPHQYLYNNTATNVQQETPFRSKFVWNISVPNPDTTVDSVSIPFQEPKRSTKQQPSKCENWRKNLSTKQKVSLEKVRSRCIGERTRKTYTLLSFQVVATATAKEHQVQNLRVLKYHHGHHGHHGHPPNPPPA